jgi:Fanconi anemia group J protein
MQNIICGPQFSSFLREFLLLLLQVIRGLRHMTNTLIESPTGSGKTLSLICSSLAWQRAEFGEFRNCRFCLLLSSCRFLAWVTLQP